MITIVAEKYDVAGKIAAALDHITLKTGKTITYKDLKTCEDIVHKQLKADGYLKIRFDSQDCYVTFGYGHLCELKQAKDYNAAYQNWRHLPLPFFPEQYEIQLRQLPGKIDKYGYNEKIRKQFAVIKELINKSDYVINAMDNDREGEVIFAYIYQLVQCKKPVKRACFDSQTQAGIQTAFSKLKNGSEMKNKEMSGRTRSIADWVVGSNLTAAATLKYSNSSILSIGRVQTPTLQIVVSRDLQIKNFKSTPYWTISGCFGEKGEAYSAEHEKKRFENKAQAESIMRKIKGHSGTVVQLDSKTIEKSVPNLYSLASLQMEANGKFGMTLKQTLDTVQWLYENNFVTYPRTKSQFLTEDMEPVVNTVLDHLSVVSTYAPLIKGRARIYDRPHFFNDKKVDSHFAIIPTGELPTKKLEPMQSKIFDLICRSVIRMLYQPAKIERTNVVTMVNGEKFLSSGSLVVDPQWFLVSGFDKEHTLPKLNVGQVIEGKYQINEKKTEPPKHFTDKTLLAAMISAGKDLEDETLKKVLSDPSVGGIGTAATRDAIVETLIAREYIVRTGKAIQATPKGITLIQKFPVNEIKSPEMTARWEQRLSAIENGTESSTVFIRDIEAFTRKCCAELNLAAKETISSADAGELKCPICGGEIRRYSWGWGCSNYKTGCHFSISQQIAGKKLTDIQVRTLLSKGKTTKLKGFKSKTGKIFDAKLKLNAEGKVEFDFGK